MLLFFNVEKGFKIDFLILWNEKTVENINKIKSRSYWNDTYVIE